MSKCFHPIKQTPNPHGFTKRVDGVARDTQPQVQRERWLLDWCVRPALIYLLLILGIRGGMFLLL